MVAKSTGARAVSGSQRDPIATLCAELKRCGLDIKPATLADRLRRLGLRVVNEGQDEAHAEWMRKFRDGTLSERKIIGAA